MPDRPIHDAILAAIAEHERTTGEKLSARELERRTGLSNERISRYLRGGGELTTDAAEAIMGALGLTISAPTASARRRSSKINRRPSPGTPC